MEKSVTLGIIRSISSYTPFNCDGSCFLFEQVRLKEQEMKFRFVDGRDDTARERIFCENLAELVVLLNSRRISLLVIDLCEKGNHFTRTINDLRRAAGQNALIFMILSERSGNKTEITCELDGVLQGPFTYRKLFDAVSIVRKGYLYNSSVSNEKETVPADKTVNSDLTDREKEIVRQCALGKSAEEIANELYLSAHTVYTHRRNIYKKLGLSNVKELICFAYQSGMHDLHALQV